MNRTIALLPALAAVLILPSPSAAQDAASDDTLQITGAAELTSVWSSGNADASTFGAAGNVRFVWPRSEVKLEAGGLRTESTRTFRRAVGTATDFEVDKTTDRERTAENYYARTRADYRVSELFLVFAGVDWLRNTFAGIDSRFLVAAGAGNTWVNDDRFRFKTDYGVTYTFQNDVVSNPFTNSNFPGVRAAYDFWHRISSTTELTSALVGDLNLDNTDDVRLNFLASLQVAISSRLALKPSIQLLWLNDPALTEVPLFSPAGDELGSVLVPLQKLDSYYTLAIVLKL